MSEAAVRAAAGAETDAGAPPATIKETMAVFMARQVRNGDYISLGTNLPIPTAGVLLAHLTHAPDLKINVLSYFVNLSAMERFEDLTQIANPRVQKWAEAVMSLEAMVNAIPRMDLCFAGGLQVDRYGNTNLIGVGRQERGWKFRGPGSVGTATVMALVKKYWIFVGEHSPRTLVEQCEHRSSAGWDLGGAGARRKLGLPGGGPEYIITPKCVFDFDEETKEARIRWLFPPVSVEDVIENTGFRPLVHPQAGPVQAPTEDELAVLRQRVDIKGLLRR